MPKIYQNLEKFAAHKTSRAASYYFKVRPNGFLSKSCKPQNADQFAIEVCRLLRKTEQRLVALTGAERMPEDEWKLVQTDIAKKVKKNADTHEVRISSYFDLHPQHFVNLDLIVRLLPKEVHPF